MEFLTIAATQTSINYLSLAKLCYPASSLVKSHYFKYWKNMHANHWQASVGFGRTVCLGEQSQSRSAIQILIVPKQRSENVKVYQ